MPDDIQALTGKINKTPTADLYCNRAELYYDVENYDEALKDYNKAIELKPDWEYPYNGRGNVFYKCYRDDEALKDYNKAIELKPDWERPYNGRGNVFSQLDRYDEALKEYNKATELKPDWEYPYNNRGNVFYQLGRYDEAIKEYNRATELKPDLEYPYSGRGKVFSQLDRYDEALKEYNKATELKPDWEYPYNGRGDVFYQLDRYDEALKDYNKATEIDPNMTAPYYNRGLIFYALNKYEDALLNYQNAYDRYKQNDNYYKLEAKKKIDELTAKIASEDAEKDDVRRIIDKTKIFQNEINKNKKNKSDFFNHKYQSEAVDGLEFTVLRKWNSFTPIVAGGFRSSKGGGYFIKNGGYGIVIDPGFNFIENFITEGYKFSEINAVMITHAHNDHTSDLDSLLTILHKYNDDLFGSYTEYKENSVVDEVLEKLKYSREDIKCDFEKRKEVEKETDRIFAEKRKVITFYITSGIFKKYAGFFSLMKISNYKIVCIDDENSNIFKIENLKVRVIKAKHHDIVSDATAVGFCFELGDFVLIYTGDTGFWGMDVHYKKLMKLYKTKNIVLVANIGGFKGCENSYTPENCNEEMFYKNHLGRLGIAKLVERVKPKICIISEFGEEFDGYRIKIADIFNNVYKEKSGTVFLPADVGLCINTEMKVRAISKLETEDPKSRGTDKYGFPCDFVDAQNVKVYKINEVSELYYYFDKLDEKDVAAKKTAKFYESIK